MEKEKVKGNNSICIKGWMVKDLKLSSIDLIVYAIIYSFNSKQYKFTGSREYFVEWCNCSVKTVQRSLNKLVHDGRITKKVIYKNGLKYCEYEAVVPKKYINDTM